MKQKKQKKLVDTHNKALVVRGREAKEGWAKRERGPKGTNFSTKYSGPADVKCSRANSKTAAHLKVAKRADLESSHDKRKHCQYTR